MTLPYIYQSTHSISFLLSALTYFILLPYKMVGKEGQSIDVNFWHPVESILHQHWCSKFLMKSRIIWSIMIIIKNQGYISLHVTKINDSHCTSFHVAFHVISCYISHTSLYALHASHTCHACRAFRISRIARIPCIAPHSASFYVSFYVILSWKFIAYSFIPFRIKERRNRVKTSHSSIERRLSGTF